MSEDEGLGSMNDPRAGSFSWKTLGRVLTLLGMCFEVPEVSTMNEKNPRGFCSSPKI